MGTTAIPISGKKLSALHVRSLEEEIMLIQEAERNYDTSKCMTAEEAYIKGLEFIKNLGK